MFKNYEVIFAKPNSKDQTLYINSNYGNEKPKRKFLKMSPVIASNELKWTTVIGHFK